MPNWVKNIVTIAGPAEDIAKVLDLIRDKDPVCPNGIDFDNVIPMPKRLNIVSGGYDRQYVALYLNTLDGNERMRLHSLLKSRPVSWYGTYVNKYQESFRMWNIPEDKLKWMRERFKEDYRNISPESMEDVGKAYIDNIIDYGDDTWYEWCVKHWGTKWNACECKIGDDYLEFDTAWSAPFPVITELSRRFPDLSFHHEWADEDLGRNCGRSDIRNGLVVANYAFASDDEAYEFACNMWGYDPEPID